MTNEVATNTVQIVTNSADHWLQKLDGIQGWSAATLIFASCIIVGYILRFWKRFPNTAIPQLVILWGGIAMMLLASARPTTMQQHVWIVRNFFVGLIIGAFAWAAHNLIIRRIETLIGERLSPAAHDTTFFKKEPVQQPPKDKPIDNPAPPDPPSP